MDWNNDKDLKVLAENICKDYIQPHILVRWVMLYREILKIPLFIEVIKGNLENKIEYIPGSFWLCDQIIYELENTPDYKHYLPETQDIFKIICSITFKNIDCGTLLERENSEKEILEKVKDLKLKILNLFKRERHNLAKADFQILDKEGNQELLNIYNILNSQIKNDLL